MVVLLRLGRSALVLRGRRPPRIRHELLLVRVPANGASDGHVRRGQGVPVPPHRDGRLRPDARAGAGLVPGFRHDGAGDCFAADPVASERGGSGRGGV